MAESRVTASGWRAAAAAALLACAVTGCSGGDDPAEETLKSCPEPPVAGEIQHLIAYGQSLSVGAFAVPAITTSSRHDSLKFSGGVRPGDGGSKAATIYGGLAPLTETTFGNYGETPVAGALEQINDLIQTENSVSPADTPQQYLGSSAGVGGLTLAQLSKGSAPYAGLLDHIYYGKLNAGCLRKNYSPRAVLWMQGESDYAAGTTQSDYAAQLQILQQDIEQDAARLAGTGPAPVPLISFQTSSHIANGSATPAIALAQWQASQESGRVILAAPGYQFDYAGRLHLTAASSKWLGAYLGIAYKRIAIDGQSWRPLEPVSVSLATPLQIRARFHVPQPPLALDTSAVSNPGNFGFSLVNSSGAAIAISGVSLSAADEVTISTSLPVTGGATLRYAFDGSDQSGHDSGPRGNLRDSQGDALVFDPGGIAKPMHNWCVIFEMPVT